MHMEWRSKKGQGRLSNSDAAAAVMFGSIVCFIVVDAAESKQSQVFANLWAKRCIELVDLKDQSSPDALILKIQNQWQALRLQYLHERASYSLVTIDTRTRNGLLMFVGDIRAGLAEEGGHIKWINRPHTLEFQQLEYQPDAVASESSRHQLTHCYNAKRFASPESVSFLLDEDSDFILCSDGYWREHLQDQVMLSDVNDDCSVLLLLKDLSALSVRSDTDNFYLREKLS